MPAPTWQPVTYRPGQKGPSVRQAVLLPVWRWECGEAAQAQPRHRLIFREPAGTQVKYSLCYTPPGASALGVEPALYRQMQRYWIERVFQGAKRQLGLHQNQTRHWPAWQHHVALTMMALHFILEAQLRERETIPTFSFASLKLVLAQKLLNQEEALPAALHRRALANTPKLPKQSPP